MRKKIIVNLVSLMVFFIPSTVICNDLFDPIEVFKKERLKIRPAIDRLKKMRLTKEEIYKIILSEKTTVTDAKAAINLIGELGDLSDIPRLKKTREEILNRRINIFSIPCPEIEISAEIPKAIAMIYTRSKTADREEMIKLCSKMIIECRYKKINDELLCSGIVTLFEETEYTDDEIRLILEYLNNKELRGNIIGLINNNPNKLALEPLINVFRESKSEFYSIRYWTVRAIQKIGDKSAIPFLKEIANDKNEHEKVRKAAEKAIEVLSK